MDPASYEAHLAQRACQHAAFFLLTCGALQVVALLIRRSWMRARCWDAKYRQDTERTYVNEEISKWLVQKDFHDGGS